MLSDNFLLKALSTRSIYYKYKPHVQLSALLDKSVQIFKDMHTWFEMSPDVDTIDWDEFSQWFRLIKHSTFGDEELKVYAILFERLSSLVNEHATLRILESLAERHHAKNLTQLALDIIAGKEDFGKVLSIVEEYNADTGKLGLLDDANDPDLISDDIEALLEETYGETSGGLDWPLKEMNLSLGPLRIGDAALIAGFVDSGKSSLVLFSCQHMVKQLPIDKQIIYFANEERGKNVKLRFIQAILKWETSQMRESFKGTLEAYKKVLDPSRFVLYHNPNMDTRYVEERLKRHNPGLIVIDQLANVGGFEKSASSNVDRISQLAQWARKIAGIAPCLYVHQAGGECNGVKFIEMHQLYNSRVGLQAAADCVITLGREHGNLQSQYQRGLYFPKNKLIGGANSDKDLKNAKWDVDIDPHTCSFKGVYGV